MPACGEPAPSHPMEAHMHSILVILRRLARAECGATAIEYGLLAALIALVILAGVGAMGNAVNTVLYEPIGDGLRVAAGP
jgi:pilus assembly protein Flp/PilA